MTSNLWAPTIRMSKYRLYSIVCYEHANNTPFLFQNIEFLKDTLYPHERMCQMRGSLAGPLASQAVGSDVA